MSDNDNVVQFKGIFHGKKSAVFVVQKLLEFVQDHPDAELLIGVRSKSENFITAGWSAVDAGDLLLISEFIRMQVISNIFEQED
jgi:hypothetical protein